MTLNKLTTTILSFAVAIFLFGTGYKLGEYRGQNIVVHSLQNNSNIDFSLFWETWRQLQEKYVDKKKIDPQKMYYGAIKGVAASVEDPYTFFLTPEENVQAKDDLGGKFEGIGAQLGLKDNHIVVIAPLKKSPAERAGVKAGDIIVKVNDQSTEAWTLFKAVSTIRGKKGTKVRLTVLRQGKELTFNMLRDEITVESVELTYEQNVAVLKLNRFGDDTNRQWDTAIANVAKKWHDKQIAGMILDMRDNPGGYLQSSVYIASEFLPKGKVVVKQQYTNTPSEVYRVEREGKLTDIPLVVLVNKGSASASEIVAGALRDHKRVKLVGETTFGKGSIQEALDLKGGAGLHVTVAKWILPGGDWINGRGVKPDFVVEIKIKEGNTTTRQDDTQLDKALELLTKK